ncbi:MFS transporter [Chelatococcus reniformis]|uniref:MFS transporter n=1 Tax=Chelatococcus reniformis TaxID=1494448 RepID=A0A916UPV6_9HYPH|nr:MFS transporter [Chelatococcus reniformis]GGC81361.1 MFS transporter [Chelatococcus reniformis]
MNTSVPPSTLHPLTVIDGPPAWKRLVVAVLLSMVGGVGMWSVVVALPAVQAEFGVARAEASLPFTLTMVGFGLGGVAIGRMADRMGITIPSLLATAALASGYLLSALAPNITVLAVIYGALIGFGASAGFGPLVADISHWFARRRGLAIAICASGNYLAGTFWPPIVERAIDAYGWRAAHVGVGLFCAVAMVPLALLLRRRLPTTTADGAAAASFVPPERAFGITPGTLQALLVVAGVGCCVAMSMPQVHIVAYCGDLGYGVARGAEMLALMLACGIISRIGSGFIADRIGGLRTLLLGSVLQGLALLLYLFFDGLTSLYVISALFGLFQGGIVPSYAIIIRDFFSPREAGGRLGLVVLATVFGMALGGWLSGKIFDLAGSYQAAFLNGLGFNLLNVAIIVFLMVRSAGQRRHLVGAPA